MKDSQKLPSLYKGGPGGIFMRGGDIRVMSVYERIKYDEPVKSHQSRHPGESRGPEVLGIAGFRLPPE